MTDAVAHLKLCVYIQTRKHINLYMFEIFLNTYIHI